MLPETRPRSRGSQISAGGGPAQGLFLHPRRVQRPVDEPREPDRDPLAPDRDQPDLDALPRPEARRRPGRNGEAHAVGRAAVEVEARVGLEEVEVGGDGDRHGGGVRHDQPQDGLGLGVLGPRQQRTRAPVREPAATDGVGHDRQSRAVVEDGLDMHLGDDVRHARQHVVRPEHGPGTLDRLGEAGAVAGGLADGVRDECGRLGHVQPEPSGPARPGQFGGSEEQQPVTFRRGQSHDAAPPCRPRFRASL